LAQWLAMAGRGLGTAGRAHPADMTIEAPTGSAIAIRDADLIPP
jgi:hypothetical protein